MSEKIIRDPVHDVIALRLDRPEELLLFNLLNTTQFQRLRRIRQLGLACLAYPGAEHTRFSHSLGVMQTARKMLARLSESFDIDQPRRIICLAAALLHDLGHGPFSHVFERVSLHSHEAMTTRLLLDEDSEIHRVLAQHDTHRPQQVANLLEGKPARTFYSDIVSSQLDADRFDYLLRDNLMTGSQYGAFDLQWLLHALTIDSSSQRLAVSFKGVSAVEAYLQSRYHMYRNVYFHKVVRSAEGMVKLALQRANRLAIQDRLPWPPPHSPMHKSLLAQQLSIGEFLDLDDVSVMHCLKTWAGGDDPVLGQLCRGLLHRRLFKTVDLTHFPLEQIPKVVRVAQEALRSAGAQAEYQMFYDEPSDTPYETCCPDAQGSASEILVCGSDGKLTPFASISPMTGALNRQLMFRRLHVAETFMPMIQQQVNRGM